MSLVIRCNGFTLVGARASEAWRLKPTTEWTPPFYSGNPRRCGKGRNSDYCKDNDYPDNYCYDSPPGFPAEPCRTRWQGT